MRRSFSPNLIRLILRRGLKIYANSWPDKVKSKEPLPPLPDEAFDGEKYSAEIKAKPCKHRVILVDGEIKCKKCGAGWRGPHIERLYEAFKKAGRTGK